jgi:hypothetical protein
MTVVEEGATDFRSWIDRSRDRPAFGVGRREEF